MLIKVASSLPVCEYALYPTRIGSFVGGFLAGQDIELPQIIVFIERFYPSFIVFLRANVSSWGP